MSAVAATPPVKVAPSRRRRILKIVFWLVGIALFLLILQLLGIDVRTWLKQLWDSVSAIPTGYLPLALAFATGQTLLVGASYYGILKAAYRAEVALWPVVTAYAVGVALNGFLPANIGTFVTLLMFVAIIPSCSFAGALAAYLVQKIFFVLAGTFTYLYMFLSVPGSFNANLGNLSKHTGLVVAIAVGAVVLLVLLGRVFWRQVKKLWAQAKEGGVILSQPKRYFTRSFLPELLGWACGLAVTATLLAAFTLPATFQSVIWVSGSGSLANVASFTPGSVGVTQATNALALKVCCEVPRQQAVDYSTAQQLVTTAWNQIVAIILVCLIFGWSGGKQLVGDSYSGAKAKVAERKEERQQKKQAKQETAPLSKP
jgi:uncharacterized membrane protein YbhN (UPF0104 family)